MRVLVLRMLVRQCRLEALQPPMTPG